MRITRHTARTIWVAAAVLLALAVVLAVFAAAYRSRQGSDPGSRLVSQSPSPGEGTPTPEPPVATVAEPTASASATASPVPTASASPTSGLITLPAAARQTVADFYAAYKVKNREALEGYFTPDATDEQRSLHSTLFDGVDLSGNPGGPTLFSTNSAAESVGSYTVSGTAPQDAAWQVTVREQRLSGDGAAAGEAVTLLRLVPSSGSRPWLIDAYYRAGSSGKYGAFLLE